MLGLLRQRLPEVLKAVAPLVAVVIALQLTLVGAPAALFVQFMIGSALAVLGMLLLFAGIDVGILPMGRYIGAELPKKGSLWLIVGVGFALGLATTIAEPDVLVLARQVETVAQNALAGQTLTYVIAIGVGLFAALALLRVIRGFSMTKLLTAVYALMLLLSVLAPAELVPLAYDAGSVTTGVLTAPVLLALALGFTSVLADRASVSDGFGLLGLASAGPIIVILLLGVLLG
jgi:hypothetical protein